MFHGGERMSGPLNGATIAFDLDGTLVDTAPDLVGTLNWLLGEEGHPPLPLDEARPFIGRGARFLIERGFAAAGAALPADRLPQLFDRFIARYLAHIADESRPFEGVADTLGLLRQQGARLAVCTNKRTDLSRALLDAVSLSTLFDAIVGPDLAGAQKPDGRHLLAAVEAAGGDAARVVMVGDAVTDVGAARNAGSGLVLVSFGYTETPAADLDHDVLIDHYRELPPACLKLLAVSA
jgi:phosphoglycolate phosphatase